MLVSEVEHTDVYDVCAYVARYQMRSMYLAAIGQRSMLELQPI